MRCCASLEAQPSPRRRQACPAWADTLDEIKKAGKIRIAIDTAIPPFGMTDDKMQPTGSDVDLARLLANHLLGVQLEIVTTTGPSRIPMLQTNKADIVVSTLSITPDRAKVIDFSIPPRRRRHPSVVAGLKTHADQAASPPRRQEGRGRSRHHAGQRPHPGGQGRPARALRGRRHHGADLGFGPGRFLATACLLLPAISKKNPARTAEPRITMQTNYLAIGVRKDEPGSLPGSTTR